MEKLTFPIGRMVWGSCYEPQTKNFDGTPLVIKTGPDAGKPTVKYAFGVAIPKGPERSWAETPWGQKIVAEAVASFPRGEYQQASFAWKITDGDSTAIRKGATRPVNQATGFAGHWVVAFSSSYPPKLCRDEGATQIVEPNFIKTGYYVQVAASVNGNKNLSNPGVFINHDWVNFSGYGAEIFTGTDPVAAGFGGALPAGATAAPVGGGFSPAGFAPGALPSPVAQPLPGLPGHPGAGFVPGLPSPIAAPAPVPVAAAPVLVDRPGAAATVAQCRAAQWTDEQIVAGGYGVWQAAAQPSFIAHVPVAPVAPALPVPPAPAPVPVAPPARTLVPVPGAQFSIEQCRAAQWTDDVIVQQGYATWGVAAPAGVHPVPSFLLP
jgi:hypothetical protein